MIWQTILHWFWTCIFFLRNKLASYMFHWESRCRTVTLIIYRCMNLWLMVYQFLLFSASGDVKLLESTFECILFHILVLPKRQKSRKCDFVITDFLRPTGHRRGQITNDDTGSNLLLKIHFFPPLLGYTSISCGSEAACDQFRRTVDCSVAIQNKV